MPLKSIAVGPPRFSASNSSVLSRSEKLRVARRERMR